MNEWIYCQEMHDMCITKAIRYYQNGEPELAAFWYHAADGFMRRVR